MGIRERIEEKSAKLKAKYREDIEAQRARRRKWYHDNREAILKKTYELRKDPAVRLKLQARQVVYGLLKRGTIKREPCMVCGEKKVQAHHYKGYGLEHRRDLQWLCGFHHAEADKQLDAAKAAVEAEG